MNWFTDSLWVVAAAEQTAEHAAEAAHGPKVLFLKGTILQVDTLVAAEWGIMVLLLLIAFLLGRGISRIPRTKTQGMLELLFSFLEGWLAGFVGSHKDARKYLPLLGTFFIFILMSNYSGLVPGAGSYFMPPTAMWGTTAGLGAIAALAAVSIGIREMGFGPWFRHLTGIDNGIIAAVILFPLNILEEFAIRPFSLSLRLFGNIYAEEKLLESIVGMLPLLLPIPIMGLSLLFGGIQAVVFTTLSAIYIGGALEAARHHLHAAHGHDDGHQAEHGRAEVATGHH